MAASGSTTPGDQGDRALLSYVLTSAATLKLQPDQEARLSRLYWSTAVGEDVRAELGRILTAEQYDGAIRGFQADHGVGFEQMVARLVDEQVDAAVATHVRSASIVEAELAAGVAGKLAEWVKTFGFFIAAPIGLILLILSIFGIQSFKDVQGAAVEVRSVIAGSQQEIDRSKAQLQANQTQLAKVRADLDRYAGELAPLIERARNQASVSGRQLAQTEQQIAALLDQAKRQADASTAQIAELQRRTNRNEANIRQARTDISKLIAGGFADIGAVPLSQQARLGAQVSDKAGRLLRCAEAEFNKNVSEGGKKQQIDAYLRYLKLPGDASIAWSAAFISFCLGQAQATDQIAPSASGAALMRSAQASGIWLPAGGGPKLQAGDIYFICRAGGCGSGVHAGIVREVGATSVTGMEGNVNNMIRVQPRTLPVNNLFGVARLR